MELHATVLAFTSCLASSNNGCSDICCLHATAIQPTGTT
jgi:hypothetical protein